MASNKEFENLLNEILKRPEYEYNKPHSGIYFIFDKKSQEVVKVGIGGDKNKRELLIRIWMHQHSPFKRGNLGAVIAKIRPDWDKAKIKKYITNELSFRYIVIEDVDKLRSLETYCENKLKPRKNLEALLKRKR